MNVRKLFSSTKNVNIFVGIILYIILFTEFFISLTQPQYNLGMEVEFSDSYFYIKKVVKDTPAYEAGIRKNTFYKSINNHSFEDFVKYRNSVSEDVFKNHYSNFFKFGDTITLIDSYDKTYTFVLEKLPLKYRIRTSDLFNKYKFFISMLMIIVGLCISLFLPTDKTVRPLVYSMYFIGITTANLFEPYFASEYYSFISTVLFDFGLYFTFTWIFEYFSQIFDATNYKNIFKYIKYIPSSIFIFKYLHIIFFKWNLYENPFYKLTSGITVICCLIFLSVFIFVTLIFPKSLTVTFKFFIIGLTFAITPLLINHFTYILSNSIFMLENDKLFSVAAFIFIPFMLMLAILHSRNLIRSRLVSWITTFFTFIILSGPIFSSLLDHFTFYNTKNIALIYIICSPLIFYMIQWLMNKFFSLNTIENERKLFAYKELISSITDTYLLHVKTTEEISKILDCSFVFYYKKNETGIWDLLYTWGPISEDARILKLNESYTKKRVAFYKDGSFSIPILRNNKTTGVIYIGPKKNGDQYLPGEHILIEQIIQAFHSHWLIYTNNRLVNELKDKNEKLTLVQENTILSMSNLIESRDGGTGAHVKRTAEYSVLISKQAMKKNLFPEEINKDFIQMIYKAAPLHDIGKIVVSDSVLKKPGKLTPEEFEQMKCHTTEGEKIVRQILNSSEDENYITMTSNIAMYHHEKWNGTGYPMGLKGNNIPLCARILAIADVFDALVSPRCYKDPMEPEKAFNIIKEDAGTHFDPVLAEIFLELKSEALEIMRHESL